MISSAEPALVCRAQGVADALETEPAIASAVLGKALQAARAAEAARKVGSSPVAVA